MKAAASKRLGERIELALQVDPEAVRNLVGAVENAAHDAMDNGLDPPWSWVAGMLVISDAINEAVDA